MRALVLTAFAASCGRAEAPTPAPAVIAITRDATALDASGPCPVANASLGPGLVVERWHVATATPVAGEPCIDIVRADPNLYELRAPTGDRRSAIEWQRAHDAIAITNAGMFHDSGAPVGLVVADGKARGIDNAKFGGYFVWDAVTPKVPAVAVLGRGCPNAGLRDNYDSLVQSYRLLDCDGQAIKWQDPKHYSAAAIGTDKQGHIIFIHARGAFTMHELSTALAAHDLAGAIFLEGGPEASLVVRGKTGSLERVGSYETGFFENDGNTAFWDLPNVIMLVART
jgi:hypothetical protein